ncbi:sulfatase-like hydrolase/transferase [Humisphaera borealis]|uniref:Sulfatase-like hydrolase/transferase n=1 Tax=Humisphaera borealis TaxID=2807512 RepID=A0A7M2WZE2_9BACT|nr:sulfatase-like hydrolase/transferase [Humisphaera borealis]QOV90809.1 sulfatase-like hydrolase/transferase [Humisphaera borealis]
MLNRTLILLLAVGHLLCPVSRAGAAESTRPNILWLTTEDIGPQLGCYGDAYADTPNLDAFAARSLLYLTAWSNAPVCAPARTTIIAGVYPTATGGEHMRSTAPLPAQVRMYPQILREAGYYCTNNSKEDYNLAPNGKVWDESSGKAHYQSRGAGQPFFAVFNHVGTHESQIRTRPHKAVHDPSKAVIPAYHPDTPEVRQDWAQYYDNITTMDGWFGKQLAELAAAGLADDTIVFFYGDHGSGMPRSKRTPLNSGLRVPLLVHVPEKWKHLAPPEYSAGGKTDRPVSFVDLAPTLFSIASIAVPDWIQGKAFAGGKVVEPRQYVFGFRGRMDERTDMVRTARDNRYVYVKNFMPHRPHGQSVGYQLQTPTTRVWKDLFAAGKLTPEQSYFWQAPKASEELYDLQSDPWEVRNLAADPAHQATLERLRTATQDWMLATRDVGLLPEGEIHSRSKGSDPYTYGHSPDFPIAKILAAARLASNGDPSAAKSLAGLLGDSDSAVRYWGAIGLLARGKAATEAHHDALVSAMTKDDSVYVRIVAAEALGKFGNDADLAAALRTLLAAADAPKTGAYATTSALQAIDELGSKAMSIKSELAAIQVIDPTSYPRTREYPTRLMETLSASLGFEYGKPAKQPKKGKK